MKFLKTLYYLFMIPILGILLYFLTAYLLTKFPHQSNTLEKKEKKIYLLYDKMHTDIILNLEETNYSWRELLPEVIKNHQWGYLGFGWGDRETYLLTPTWSDLKLSVALKALFINTPSMMHVNYYPSIRNFKYLRPIAVTKRQYQHIEQLILESFGEQPKFVHRGYWRRDIFYHSPYHYNLFYTCNTWTGEILRESNITMSYWTPLSSNVLEALASQEKLTTQ